MSDAAFVAWVNRGEMWPRDREWALSHPNIGAAWGACEDGCWLESAAQRLGFWEECVPARAAFNSALSASARAYYPEREALGQRAAMDAHDARVKAARRAFSDAVRIALPRGSIEAALAAWWKREQATEEKIRRRREENGGVYRGADDWSELPKRPEAT